MKNVVILIIFDSNICLINLHACKLIIAIIISIYTRLMSCSSKTTGEKFVQARGMVPSRVISAVVAP